MILIIIAFLTICAVLFIIHSDSDSKKIIKLEKTREFDVYRSEDIITRDRHDEAEMSEFLETNNLETSNLETNNLETELLAEDNSEDIKIEFDNFSRYNNSSNYKNTFKTGTVINKKFRIVKVLGQGGMGRVYLCTNIELGNYLAIKHFYNGNFKQRLIQAEKEVLIKLNHINLPRIIDVFSDENGAYIVQTYIEGTSLQMKMEKEGPFSEGDVLKWGLQLAKVLSYLHNFNPSPIIYRDMKPSNVIISPEGDAILIDFGTASEIPHEMCDKLSGMTIEFAAPEQKKGLFDKRTDVYNLGMMLHYLLTNAFPDDERSELKYINISDELKKIILKAIDKNSECRHQNMGELIEEANIIIENRRWKHIKCEDRGSRNSFKSKKVIVVASLESVGKTTIAVNLSYELSARRIHTTLIDTDTNKKDVYYHFENDYTNCLSRIDQEKNQELAQKINKYLDVYSEHRDIECNIANNAIMKLISDSKKKSEAVIVDLSNMASEKIKDSVFLLADHILFVTDQRVNHINRISKNVNKYFSGVETVDLLINKYTDISFLDKDAIISLLKQINSDNEGLKLKIGSVFTVKNDYGAILKGLAERRAAISVEGSKFRDDFRLLGDYYFPSMVISDHSVKKKLMKFFGSIK